MCVCVCVCAFVHVHIPEGGLGWTRDTHTYGGPLSLLFFFFLSSTRTVKHAPVPPVSRGEPADAAFNFFFFFFGKRDVNENVRRRGTRPPDETNFGHIAGNEGGVDVCAHVFVCTREGRGDAAPGRRTGKKRTL